MTGPARAPRLIHDLPAAAPAAHPDRPAVTDRTGTWTYAELDARARAFATWLDRHGVRAGDRVLARAGNVREFVAMLYGTVRHGAIFVPVNPATKPFHLTAITTDAGPALAVDEGDALPRTGRTHALSTIWPQIERLAAEPAHPGRPPVEPDDLGLLMYTSGSTSAPKAVMSPHRAVVFATGAIASRLRYRADDVVLTAVPLSFDYGLYQIFLAALAGAELVLSGPQDHTRLIGLLREHRVTVVPVVPSLGEMLLRLRRRDRDTPPPVRLFTSTGAALTTPVIDGLRAAFPGARVAPMYGITECKRVTILEPDGDLARPGSVGRPLPGTQVRIVGDDGARLPAGEVGEITVAGPHVMAGYWQALELTAQRFRTDPVSGEVTLHTGDYGRVDADGHLYFEGRRDDLFKRRGVRTSVREIEAAALDVPGVREAAVLPPDGSRDLTVFAVTELSPAQVLRAMEDRLESAKVPAACHVVDSLPLTPNGKIDKRVLDGDR
ncbi:class I adenylate-forming enzyme family protein [Actinoallomurus sp. CA-150999]|uniref:class I adenylate-forming enzyme family protein n=1 Tax=Actinoallomurus sp. CA-150999 TaxID=3239887 RepID=UPI003D92EA13